MKTKEPMLKKACGYNLRERMNVYAGTALGVILPAIAVRYGCMNSVSDDLGTQLACGLVSTILAIPLMPITLPLGLITGMRAASGLQKVRD